MRILVFGHHSNTGFGVVTEELGKRFVEAGHDVRIFAVNHRGEPITGPLAGRIWPTIIGGDSHGGNISADAIAGTLWQSFGLPAWKPDVVLIVADMSGFSGHVGQKGLTGPWASVPVFHYCPIEGDNLPVNWRNVWNQAIPVAMAEYGAQVIANHIGRPVPLIHHGVDSDAYHRASMTSPIVFGGTSLTSKEACRAAFGLKQERRYVLRVDRLAERKFYHVFVDSMAEVMRADPLVDAIVHCRPIDPPLNLHAEIARLPSDLQARFILSPYHNTFYGLPVEGLAALYNAADVLYSPTGGEGFGLTLAESLACETPVVTTDFAAGPEVVGDGGVLIPPLTDSYGERVRFHSQYGMDWAVPDGRAAVKPLLDLLAKPARRRSLGMAGRIHVRRSFSWDTAAASFLHLFEETNVDAAVGDAA